MSRGIFQSYIITVVCFLFSANGANWNGKYYKAKGAVSLQSAYSVRAQNLVECSSRCLSRKCSCYSYDTEQGICEVGECTPAFYQYSNVPKQLYVSCDPNLGFRLWTYNSITACVWVSDDKVEYTVASNRCNDMSSHLYTIKNVDKMKLLEKTFGSVALWIGLNDIAVEGHFRWVDDNSEIGLQLEVELFFPGKPNNFNNEDCARYTNSKIFDDECSLIFKYICEKPFFNVA